MAQNSVVQPISMEDTEKTVDLSVDVLRQTISNVKCV